jgi:WD40 repeat protein
VAGGKEIRTINDSKKEKDDKGPPGGFPPGFRISSIAFSPDAKVLATRGFDQIIRLYDTGTGKEIRQIGKPPQPGVATYVGNAGGGNTLAFLADGKGIVSAAGMEMENQKPAAVLRIYDVESGKELKQIKTGQQNFRVSGVAVLPKSKTIAWAGTDGTVGLYDAESGKEIRRLGKEQQNVIIRTLLISPDGKIMATQATNSPAIHLWDVASGKELRKLGQHAQGNSGQGIFFFPGSFGSGMGGSTIAFSADGQTLAEGTAGNSIRLWKVDTGKEIVPVSSGHHGDVNRLAVSPDGKVLTTFAGDQTIRQWDVATGKELRQVKLPATASNVGLSADGKLAAWNTGAKVSLWDIAQGKEVRTIDLPGQGQQQLVFFPGMGMNGAPAISANGKLVAVRDPDQVIRVFDTATGKEHRQLVEQDNAALPLGRTSMAFLADGATFAAISNSYGPPPNGGGGASLRMWNLAQGKHPRLFDTQQQAVLELAVTPDGRTVVTANSDYTIFLWEALTGKECLQIKLNRPAAQPQPQQPQMQIMVWGGMMPQTNLITAMAISPDGRTLAAALDRNIHLWDLRTGKELGQFKGHKGTVVSVVFAPDNQTVITGSADTTALVWDGGRLIKKSTSVELKAEQIQDLWKDLAGDPMKAYQAIATLSAAPRQAVDLVKANIKPAAGVDDKRIEQLIADLESDKFQTRQKATKELEKLGELAEPALKKSLQTLKWLESKRRVEKLLDQIANDQTPSADVVRTLRAVQVLGNLGTPEAHTELERLAKGAPGDKLTRHVEATLKRLGK